MSRKTFWVGMLTFATLLIALMKYGLEGVVVFAVITGSFIAIKSCAAKDE